MAEEFFTNIAAFGCGKARIAAIDGNLKEISPMAWKTLRVYHNPLHPVPRDALSHIPFLYLKIVKVHAYITRKTTRLLTRAFRSFFDGCFR